MAEIRNLTRNGETFYPLTTSSAVINERTGEGYVIDEEPTLGSQNLVESGGVCNLIKEVATNGKPLNFNDFIFGYYTNKNGGLTAAELLRTTVYSVQPNTYLLLRWYNDSSNINFGVLFSNVSDFSSISSYVAPYTTTEDSAIIKVPSGVSYVAFSKGSLTLLDGKYEGVVDENINNDIKNILSDYSSYIPLTLSDRKTGYLTEYGTINSSQTALRINLYSVTVGQVIYFKQTISSPYAYYGFCDDSNMSHIISYTKTGYGEFTRIVVPEGANYLMINAMGETTGNVPSTVSCLGRPILNTKNTSFPVFNYFPAYSLNEDNIVIGVKGGVTDYTKEHIETGNEFIDYGTLKYVSVDLSTQRMLFQISPSNFRTQFKTTGKLRVTFDATCEYDTTIDVRLYTFGITPLYQSKLVAITSNNVKQVDLLYEINTEQISNITEIDLYIFRPGSAIRTIKVTNIIVTDDIFGDEKPQPYYSRDWGIITRPIPYLYNKCIYIGDSISTDNNYDWKSFIEETYTIPYVRSTSGLNPANGGITIRPSIADESSLPNDQKSIWYRCANSRMSTFDFNIINLFGGQNDKSIVVPNLLGTINDKPYVDDASLFDNPSNYTDTWSDSLTFAQCYMGCIEMLKRDFPTKKLLLMTIYPTRGDSNGVEQMAMLQCKIAHKYGLDITPLYWGIFNIDSVDAFTIDGTHPNSVLARQMAIKFSQTLGI